MKTGTTLYNFEITLSDVRRGVYEALTVRAAQHQSETIEYLITRVLAYCLEYREGIEFSNGLDDPDSPALWVYDLTRTLSHWIEIGAPSAERLHKASKKVPHVAIYTYKDPGIVLAPLREAAIHRAEEIPLYHFDGALLSAINGAIKKRNIWSLSINEEQLYLEIEGKTIEGVIGRHAIRSSSLERIR